MSGIEKKFHPATIALSAGMQLANVAFRDKLTVHADDPLSRKLLRGMPSAFVASEVTGNKVVDTAAAIAMAATGTEAARRTTSMDELIRTGLEAQLAAIGVNTAISESKWLPENEKSREDDGFSAVALAFGIKSLLDRAHKAESTKKRLAWYAGAAALAGVSTVVPLSVKKPGHGGVLEAAAHASGVAVGVRAHLRGLKKTRS